MNATEYLGQGSKWLKAKHFLLNNRMRATLHISECTLEEVTDFNGQPRKQLALHFHGQEKIFGLNDTNNETMILLHGPDTDQWIGKSVGLFVTKTRMKDGELRDCLRIEQRPVKQIEASVQPIANGSPAAPRRMAAMEQRPAWKSSSGPPPAQAAVEEWPENEEVPF